MWILYQLLMGLALLLAAPFLLLARGSHYLQTLLPRLGRFGVRGGDAPIWLHAVSVGEVAVAATLMRALPPEPPLLLTTVTPTGQERARSTLAERATVTYLPFDLGFAVNRFFRRFEPRALVLVEGDLWPLVLRGARRRGLPIVVVNGRVSDGSFRRMRRLRPLLGPLLDAVDRFGVQTEEDGRRLAELGVSAASIQVTGNLKFDSPAPEPLPALEQRLAALADGRPILIAGSTMKGEEELVLAAYRASGAEALLVIAPRHPERWNDVAALVDGSGLTAVRRSAELDGQRPQVLLLDSLGELAALYRASRAAFVGGTLVPTGGHNPLEPARFGVPVTVGPSMENFRDMAAQFDRADAWRRVSDAAELGEVWRGWLAQPEEARAVGARGQALVEANGGALERTLELLAPILAESS